MELLKKRFGERNHNRLFPNLLQCSNPAVIQAVIIVPIEANHLKNLQINKQSVLRELKFKLENMQFVGMKQRSRWRMLA